MPLLNLAFSHREEDSTAFNPNSMIETTTEADAFTDIVISFRPQIVPNFKNLNKKSLLIIEKP